MRYFQLLNNQQVIVLILVAVIFMILFAVALAFTPLIHSKDKDESNTAPLHQFIDDIEEGDHSFPLINALLVLGVVLWALFYILYHGFSGVNI